MYLKNIGWKMAGRGDGCKIIMEQIISLIFEIVQVGLKEIRTVDTWTVMQVTIGIALYCEKNDQMDHMFCRVSPYNKGSVGFQN